MRKHWHATYARLGHANGRVRLWLRRVMPRVAIVAAVLFGGEWIVDQIPFLRDRFVDSLLDLITFLFVAPTVVYYGFKALRWSKNRLLWRVRRRLAISYLFLGLTPIVLLTSLGMLFALSTSLDGMSRTIADEVSKTQDQAVVHARTIADRISDLPPNESASNRNIQAWLDERQRFLQASLPGARIALWRSASSADVDQLARSRSAQFVSEPSAPDARGVGNDATPVSAPLPVWLQRDQAEWSALSYFPPSTESAQGFATPSVRAVVRRNGADQALVVLLVVPVSRALIEHYRNRTGITVRPMFRGQFSINEGGWDYKDDRQSEADKRSDEQSEADKRSGRAEERSKDQFGEELDAIRAPVQLTATNWLTGQSSPRTAFDVNPSMTAVLQGVLSGSITGQVSRLILVAVGLFFLFLEMLAVLSAMWMTRAVTGTVHKLYYATQFIKRGDFSHRVRVRSRDQLGELAEAFNEMSANVESLLHERVVRERLEREIEIAADVQAMLFPSTVPCLLCAEVAGECRAARGVAGDYYDYIEIVPHLVVLALGDVSGKGISASLVMSNLQASLRAQTTIVAERIKIVERTAALVAATSPTAVAGATTVGSHNNNSTTTTNGDVATPSLSPAAITVGIVEASLANDVVAEMAANVNSQLCRTIETNRFATLFLALYDDATGLLRYTNAGHNAAIIVHADGSTERLTLGGMLVGAFDWAVYEEASVVFEKGDLLLLFSDGISEAVNANGEEYSEEQLVQFAVRHRALSADALRHHIFDEVDRWAGAQERGDDQTLVILKAHES